MIIFCTKHWNFSFLANGNKSKGWGEVNTPFCNLIYVTVVPCVNPMVHNRYLDHPDPQKLQMKFRNEVVKGIATVLFHGTTQCWVS